MNGWFLPQCFREPLLTISQLNYQRYHFWVFTGCIQNPLRNRRGHVPSQLERSWCFCPSGVSFLSARLETQPTAGSGLPQQSPEPERVARRVMMPLFESPRRFHLSSLPLVWLTAGIDHGNLFIPTGIKGWDLAWDIKAEQYLKSQLCNKKTKSWKNSVFYFLIFCRMHACMCFHVCKLPAERGDLLA